MLTTRYAKPRSRMPVELASSVHVLGTDMTGHRMTAEIEHTGAAVWTLDQMIAQVCLRRRRQHLGRQRCHLVGDLTGSQWSKRKSEQFALQSDRRLWPSCVFSFTLCRIPTRIPAAVTLTSQPGSE